MSAIKILSSLILLLVGGLIYLGFRDENLLLFEWCNNLGISSFISNYRELIQYMHLPSWVIYSLPDGLWVTSYMILIKGIWKNNKELQYYVWLYSLSFIAIISEIIQLFTSHIGTFDILDLICYICPTLFFIITDKYDYNNGGK